MTHFFAMAGRPYGEESEEENSEDNLQTARPEAVENRYSE